MIDITPKTQPSSSSIDTTFPHQYHIVSHQQESTTMSSKTEPNNPATNNGIDTHGMNFISPSNKVIEHIFKVLLPNRLFNGPNKDTEIDLYNSGESPEELFGDAAKDQFYTFFTKLERLNGTSDKMMKREIAGKGTWLGKSSPIPKKVKISQGKEVIAGSRRQLKFIYDENYKSCKDDKLAWILHEYVADKEFIKKYMANELKNKQNCNDFLNNIETIAFCYVYKKEEKELKPTDKRKRGNRSLAKQRKKIRPSKDIRDDDHGETIIDDGSTTTIKNDTNVDNENGMTDNRENANDMVSEANNETDSEDYDPFSFLIQRLDISTMDAAANDYGDLINYDSKDYGFGWLHNIIGDGGVDLSLFGYY